MVTGNGQTTIEALPEVVEGENGVQLVLAMLRDEFDATMGMCGCTSVASVDRACLEDRLRP